MASGRIRRLTKPEVLRQIHPARLLELLSRFKDYWVQQDFPLPANGEDIDIERLGRLLADANRSAPSDLIDALLIIDDLATPAGRDAVARVLTEAGIPLPPADDHSAADVAVEAWLRDPLLLARAHASQLSIRYRSLQVFVAEHQATITDDAASPAFIQSVESMLASRFQQLERGGGNEDDVRVYAFPFDDGVRYVVQRGGVYVRHGAVVDGKPSTVGYLPLEFDILVLNSARRELAVKAWPPAEQTVLRDVFAEALTGRADAFAQPATLDLEPLRAGGLGCLWHGDVPGIARIRLTSIKVMLNRARRYIRQEQADDLFEVWREGQSRFLSRGQIIEAGLEFTFEDSSTPRSVALSRNARIRLTRDDDGELVNEWLQRRMLVRGASDAKVEPVGFWDWLERPDDWTASEMEWRARLHSEYDHLKRFVVDAGGVAAEIQWDGDGTTRRIQPDPAGGFVAVCPNTGAAVGVDAVAIALRRIEIGTVASELATAMALLGTPTPVDDAPGAWWLGEYAPVEGTRFPVYLATVGDDAQLCATCVDLAGVSMGPFVLVTATRRFATPRVNERLGATGAGWIALSECAHLAADGNIRLRQALDHFLRQFLRIHLPQVYGEPLRPRFPTPVGAEWSDVAIRFVDGHTVRVTVRDVARTFTYEAMGLLDGRTKRPTHQWDLLYAFAKEHGTLTWASPSASRQNQKRRERLGRELKAFFCIDDDPFEAIEGGWRARFTVEPD